MKKSGWLRPCSRLNYSSPSEEKIVRYSRHVFSHTMYQCVASLSYHDVKMAGNRLTCVAGLDGKRGRGGEKGQDKGQGTYIPPLSQSVLELVTQLM